MPEAVLAAAGIDPNDEPGEVDVESTGTSRFAPPSASITDTGTRGRSCLTRSHVMTIRSRAR